MTSTDQQHRPAGWAGDDADVERVAYAIVESLANKPSEPRLIDRSDKAASRVVAALCTALRVDLRRGADGLGGRLRSILGGDPALAETHRGERVNNPAMRDPVATILEVVDWMPDLAGFRGRLRSCAHRLAGHDCAVEVAWQRIEADPATRAEVAEQDIAAARRDVRAREQRERALELASSILDHAEDPGLTPCVVSDMRAEIDRLRRTAAGL